jgi:hypothetical protein
MGGNLLVRALVEGLDQVALPEGTATLGVREAWLVGGGVGGGT